MAELSGDTTMAGYPVAHAGNIGPIIEGSQLIKDIQGELWNATGDIENHKLNSNIHVTPEQQVAWASAETNAINFAKSFGLGGPAKDISNTNLNDLNETGFFRGHSLTNAPATTWYYVINLVESATFRRQIIFSQNIATPTEVYQRNQAGATWTTWTRLLSSDMLNVANGVAGLDGNGRVPSSNLPPYPSFSGLQALTGSYTGNNVYDRVISTGITPKVLFITTPLTTNTGQGNFAVTASMSSNGLDLNGPSSSSDRSLRIISGGFATAGLDPYNKTISLNYSGYTYNYTALY